MRSSDTAAVAGAGTASASPESRLPVLVAIRKGIPPEFFATHEIISFNALLLGDVDSGKVKFLSRIASDSSKHSSMATLGVDFKICYSTTSDKSTSVKFSIWDTAGQERFRSLTKAYYKGKDCAFIMPKADGSSPDAWLEDCQRCLPGHQFYTVHCDGRSISLKEKTPERLAEVLGRKLTLTPESHGELGRALLTAVATQLKLLAATPATAVTATSAPASIFGWFSSRKPGGVSAMTASTAAATAPAAIGATKPTAAAVPTRISTTMAAPAAPAAASAALATTTPAGALAASLWSLVSITAGGRTQADASAASSGDHEPYHVVPSGGKGSLNG